MTNGLQAWPLRGLLVASLLLLGASVEDPRSQPPAGARQIDLRGVRIEAEGGLRQRYGPAFEAVERPGAGEYALRVRLGGTTTPLPKRAAAALQRPGAFWLHVAADGAELVAADESGIVNGLTTFERESAGGRIRLGNTVDFPSQRLRALHFVLRGVGEQTFRELVDQARRARMNLLIVQLADGLRLKALPQIAREDAISAQSFAALVAYARANGIDVVPEVKLLSHQDKFLKSFYPDGMYNSVTYDPRNEEVRKLVFAYLDELIGLIHPVAVHIGHDEVRGEDSVGQRNGLRRDERALPAELYLYSVDSLHEHLAERGVETWMWGDMLLSATDFPRMDRRNLNAPAAYRSLLEQLPRDVVICDWHYYDKGDFPSAKKFSDLGFEVLGATWKQTAVARAFSRYVAVLPKGRGMIATTWFEVQRGNPEVVRKIVEESGEAFWYAR